MGRVGTTITILLIFGAGPAGLMLARLDVAFGSKIGDEILQL